MTPKMKIMAAVDLSDYAVAIVRYSVWLCMKLSAELALVSVINERDLEMVRRTMIGYETFSYPDYYAEQVQHRERQLKALVEAVATPTVSCTYRILDGIPYKELLAFIDAERIQLAVVGTKGRSNLADVVVGSTARKLYRRSPIPLLTIPAGYDALP